MQPCLRLAIVVLLSVNCGGRASPTTPPPAQPPAPMATHPVSGLVYYDEDGNGRLGTDERGMPGVFVSIGARGARTDSEGHFVVGDAEEGTQRALLDRTSLPPYFEPGLLPSVSVPTPAGFALALPVVLPIGGNRPHVYLAFGDSITAGEGSGGGGWPDTLQSLLEGRWGRAEVVVDALPGTTSDRGAERLPEALAAVRPAYLLIQYGTNDFNRTSCRIAELCFTRDTMRSMIRTARAAGTLPVVATIIPVNPTFTDRFAEARNGWVVEMNNYLLPVVAEEGALLAPVYDSFVETAAGDLSSLFVDHVHPNARGHDAMAEGFFRGLTQAGPPHALLR